MVQVDVIWSYAFGASFAAASARSLEKTEAPFQNQVYTRVLLFLSILFAPSGIWLLSAFPSWETMQVASQIADLPPWLITLFAVTNVTQGILGYYVGYRFSRRGKFYEAHVNVASAWIAFWFILVCGWDTTGWQRFLYDPTMNSNIPWAPGMHQGINFFTGPVFRTLLGMGVFFIPFLFRGLVRANYQDLISLSESTGTKRPDIRQIIRRSLLTMFSIYLLIAIAASTIVRVVVVLTDSLMVGYMLGLPLSVLAGWQLLFKRGRPMYRWLSRLFEINSGV